MGATQALMESALAGETEEICPKCGFKADHDPSVHDFLGDKEKVKWP